MNTRTVWRADILKNFRAKRYENEFVNIVCVIDNETFEVKDWSRTGLSFSCNGNISLDDILNVKVKYKTKDIDIDLYDGAIQVVRTKHEEGSSAVEVGASTLDAELTGVTSALHIQKIKEQISHEESKIADVDAEVYKLDRKSVV